GDRCRVRWVVADAGSALGEDGLEHAAVENAEAAADGELPFAARQRLQEAVAVPVRRVGETEARVDVAAAAEAVVDEVVALLRRADVLVAGTEVQHEVVRGA